ncbi:hypothetical protein GPECTOR_11g316 [Gonium pectorale]|uniref:Poly(A) RNA polymerase mitochondrial-like central palm domain-containing protein n=1 Tax=Gonium pectorale TaxID=33097 RepID=A0A150GPZ6_GONPE|nr:hypothetical protein GPECTOR_11g316 [Gonium pectorale]|eukprot:KXZ51881.1 hypothetical protein GPECTOR_11g316 [Gonium pectorale]
MVGSYGSYGSSYGSLEKRHNGPQRSGPPSVELTIERCWRFDQEQHKQKCDKDAAAFLEERLQQLAKSREPSPHDGAARHATMERLRALLPTLFPPPSALVLVAYGSFRSTCYSPDSDLDLALAGRLAVPDWMPGRGADGTAPLESLREEDWVALLRRLADGLEAGGLTRGPVTRILEARVPIIK